jgi:sugar-specific transcriptional regulator TrmB
MATMLREENLIRLGFNQNEARVYLSLAKYGQSDAHQIIKDTKFHKNIVYDNLDKLINKGLVTYIIEGKKRIFSISSPDMLVEHVNENINKLNEKKNLAIGISNEIKANQRILPQKQEASILRGKDGIRAYHKEIIKNQKSYFIFGAPKQSVEIMGDHFWENFEVKRIDKKIKVSMIFNSSLEDFGKKHENKYTDIRIFDKDFEPLTQTDVHKDKVAIIVWSETPLLFLIEDKEVAKSYKQYFEKMWKIAKK